MGNQEFLCLLREEWPGLATEVYERLSRFRDRVLEENSKQNLTRLLEPRDFVEGHVSDVRELLASGYMSFPAMDLGSGAGVPGLLAALVHPDPWILAESEGSKAEFLRGCVQEFGLLDRTTVFSGRAEVCLKSQPGIQSVVARAVGPVERIYSWIGNCSTWNNLILFKGPKWEQEWEDFNRGRFKGRLKIRAMHSYSVGSDKKQRRILRLERVPRGTSI